MKTRGALAVVGVGFLAIGAYALFTTLRLSALPNLVVWLLGGVFVHDALIAPLVIAVGFVLTHLVSARVRPIVQGGFAVAAVLTLISIPVVLGLGRIPSNPTLLPLNYAHSLAVVLGGVLLTTAVLVVIKLIRTRHV